MGGGEGQSWFFVVAAVLIQPQSFIGSVRPGFGNWPFLSMVAPPLCGSQSPTCRGGWSLQQFAALPVVVGH